MDNFKQLEAEAVELYEEKQLHDRLRGRLEQTMGTFRFIGHVVNMYLPRMVDTVLLMSGGLQPEPPGLPPNDSENTPRKEPPALPGGPDTSIPPPDRS